MVSWRRFVPHFLVAQYESMGWEIVAEAGGHHSVWSVLMRWTREEAPPDSDARD